MDNFLYIIDFSLKDPGSLIHSRLTRHINNHSDYKTVQRVTGTRQKSFQVIFTKN